MTRIATYVDAGSAIFQTRGANDTEIILALDSHEAKHKPRWYRYAQRYFCLPTMPPRREDRMVVLFYCPSALYDVTAFFE